MYIDITDEMKTRALEEAKKREPHIKHHFAVKHMDGDERNKVGFLGEFACCEYLGINWQNNIRNDYLTIDSGDIHKENLVIDIKTETIPSPYFENIVSGKINDDETYGRRLITEEQSSLLTKYDYVIFGAFKRGDVSKWYPIGCIRTTEILDKYKVVSEAPNGIKYPVPGMPIKTSELHDISLIRNLIKGDADTLWGYSSKGYCFYHANRQCRSIVKVDDENLKVFHSNREAQDAGYSECTFCKREK